MHAAVVAVVDPQPMRVVPAPVDLAKKISPWRMTKKAIDGRGALSVPVGRSDSKGK
jgi:hypothetical protein